MNNILMIEVLDCHDTPPSVAARFWWSQNLGVTCDNKRLLAELKQEGITLPGLGVVYPKDGRAFFEALHFRFTGLDRAQPIVTVDRQGGEAD